MNKKLTALSVFTALLCTTILSPVSAFAQTAGSEETNIAATKEPAGTATPSATQTPAATSKPTAAPKKKTKKKKSITKITISAAGDCTLGSDYKSPASVNFYAKYKQKTPSYFFKNVKNIFKKDDLAVTGQELDAMSDEELDGLLEEISVYARVSPENKIRIVRNWQKKGRIVAMTGDGVNDAPALKKSDIGVAMVITGTEVSKDASSMILADDNFATIIKAVLNGRNVYRNIKNAIQFLLSGNMAAIIAVLVCSVAALPSPFKPVHLLFINLLTDSLPALAIGMEPSDPELLKQKPRKPEEGILTGKFVSHLFGYGALIAAATMAAFCMGLNRSDAMGATMAFATLTLARLFHGFTCRSERSLVDLKFSTNLWSIGAFAAGTLLLAAVLFLPGLQILFEVTPLSGIEYATILGLAITPTIFIQGYKFITSKKRKNLLK